ncbi:MFS general substrate transporter [Thozetella sp. PMI_491]|nr:MFS general substrate transporter [Thozetella sp. PMI_491]
MASPTLGGLVIDKLGWRWCFWISVPSGTFTLVALWFILTDVKPAQQLTWRERISELDLVGTVVFVPSLTCLFIALGWAGSRYAWNSPTIIGLFCTFAVLLIAFALEQYRKGDRATLPPRILRNRSVLAGFLFSMCCNSGLSVVEFYLPTYFQAVRQYSAAQSGYLMFPIVGGFIVAMLGSGWGVSKIGYYVPFMILSSILMPVFSGLICTVGVDTELARIVSYCAFFGFAAGIGFQCPQSAVQTALPEADASIGISIILFAQQFGPAVSLTAAQSIFTNKLSQNLQEVAPGLDATAIESMGLTDIKNVVGAEYLNQVLLGLDRSLIQTWYLVVGLTCATMIGSLAMEWRSVKQKKH